MKNKFNFNDKDDFLRLERLTYDGTLDYSDFPPPEYRYFAELRKVYHAFKFEELTKDNAEKQKAVLLCRYREDLLEHENRLEVYRKYQENVRKSELLQSAVNKSHNVAEIAILACQAISLMTNEPTFAKIQEKKIRGLKK